MPLDNGHEPLRPFEDDGTNHPEWLGRFVNQIAQAFRSEELLAPLGCHFHRDEHQSPEWEVTLFVSRTEFLGGARDGQSAPSRFMLDLRDVITTFDNVESTYWQSHPMADDDQVGPHVGIEGQFEGHSIWLRITAAPPAQFEAGRVVDAYAETVKNCW